MLELQLEPEAEALLEQWAGRVGQTKAEFARRAVLDRLEDCEDYEAGVAALRQSKQETAIPFDEVVKSFGMDTEFPPKGAEAVGEPGPGSAAADSEVSPRKAARIA